MMSKKHLAKAAVAALLVTASVEGVELSKETSTLLAVAGCGGSGQSQGGYYNTPSGRYTADNASPYDDARRATTNGYPANQGSAPNQNMNGGWGTNPNGNPGSNATYQNAPVNQGWDQYNRR